MLVFIYAYIYPIYSFTYDKGLTENRRFMNENEEQESE